MRHQTYLFSVIIVLGLTLSLGVNAQSPFDWQQSADGRPFVSAQSSPQEVVRASSVYSSTIYAVGTDEVPSDASNPSVEGQARSNQPGIRGLGGFGNADEIGEAAEGSPIGEPLALLLFAAAFATITAITTYIQRKKSTASMPTILKA